MALFDALVDDLDRRFALGGQARVLVAHTLADMTDPAQGGLRGFIERFRDAGLGDLAATWITKVRPGLPLAPEPLERALGSDFGPDLAARLGLPPLAVREALADALPRLVDLLTPAGFVQDRLGAEVQSFLAASVSVRPTGPAVSSPPPPVEQPVVRSQPRPPPQPERVAAAAAVIAVVAAVPGGERTGGAMPGSPPPAPAPRRGVPLWGWLAGLVWIGLLTWWAWYPPVPTPAPAPATTVPAPRAAG